MPQEPDFKTQLNARQRMATLIESIVQELNTEGEVPFSRSPNMQSDDILEGFFTRMMGVGAASIFRGDFPGEEDRDRVDPSTLEFFLPLLSPDKLSDFFSIEDDYPVPPTGPVKRPANFERRFTGNDTIEHEMGHVLEALLTGNAQGGLSSLFTDESRDTAQQIHRDTHGVKAIVNEDSRRITEAFARVFDAASSGDMDIPPEIQDAVPLLENILSFFNYTIDTKRQ